MHHQRQWWGPENTNNIMAVQTSSIILIKILVSVQKPHNHASKVASLLSLVVGETLHGLKGKTQDVLLQYYVLATCIV